jgi:hypothetical protein
MSHPGFWNKITSKSERKSVITEPNHCLIKGPLFGSIHPQVESNDFTGLSAS